MPSNRPKIVIHSNQELIDKLDKIAELENRSRSNLAETILTEWVDMYISKANSISETSTTSKIG